MCGVVLQSVEILVSFPTSTTLIGLVLFHASRTFEWLKGFWVQDGECTVLVGPQLLGLVAILLQVSIHFGKHKDHSYQFVIF